MKNKHASSPCLSVLYPMLCFFFLMSTPIDAWTVPRPTATTKSSLLASAGGGGPREEQEEALRQVIAEKNRIVANEGQYGVSDATSYKEEAESTTATATLEPERDVDVNDEDDAAAKKNDIDSDQKNRRRLERLLSTRPYPLFLAEKAAAVVENVWDVSQEWWNQLNGVETSETTTTTTTTMEGVEKVVVLGTGWGASAFLTELGKDPSYNVTVISPRNFFLFTPLLAGASVGTVEFRSITEPIREINSHVNFLEATATRIDPTTRRVCCESVVCEGNSCTIQDFDVSYDKLIVAVGAQTNTFGIPGVREYCNFLKSVQDARQIRTAIINCFERANLPNSANDRESILTFCVIGAGPTGVEFAAELRDFVEQDGPKYYPHLLPYVRIKLIEASSKVLAPFDASLQQEAIRQLTRQSSSRTGTTSDMTELLLQSGVSEVQENVIMLSDGRQVPYGVAVWAAGIGPLPITLDLIQQLSGNNDQQATTTTTTTTTTTPPQAKAQAVARGRLAVDPWLRVLGAEGSIFALGDCSAVMNGLLPATAQVAGQQGEYLGRYFAHQRVNFAPHTSAAAAPPRLTAAVPNPPPPSNTHDDEEPMTVEYAPLPLRDFDAVPPTLSDFVTSLSLGPAASQLAETGKNQKVAAPFQFLNLGILAYTGGGSALAQLQVESAQIKGRGKLGFGLWRSVYLTKQVSWRNRVLVFVDWIKSQAFGRDITRL